MCEVHVISKWRQVSFLLIAETKDHKATYLLYTLQLKTISREFYNVEKVILFPGDSTSNFYQL